MKHTKSADLKGDAVVEDSSRGGTVTKLAGQRGTGHIAMPVVPIPRIYLSSSDKSGYATVTQPLKDVVSVSVTWGDEPNAAGRTGSSEIAKRSDDGKWYLVSRCDVYADGRVDAEELPVGQMPYRTGILTDWWDTELFEPVRVGAMNHKMPADGAKRTQCQEGKP